MRPLARPIPVEVDAQTQLVAVPRGEERGTVEGGDIPQDGIPPPPGQFMNPPD